jgi:glycosyltransferase involved in cell wall biosynthesis
MDLAVITNMMAPYRLPLWGALNERMPGGIGVACLVEAESNRDWEAWAETPFPVSVLRGVSPRWGAERHLHLRVGVRSVLSRWSPDAVYIGGWDAPAYWSALRWSRRHGALAIGGWGTHAASTSRAGVRDLLRRRFLRSLDGVFAYGAAAADFAVTCGVDPHRVTPVGNPVDVASVGSTATAFAASAEGARLRGSLRPPVFAYVGQLVPRKNVMALVEAFEGASPTATLLVIGDGPLRPELAAWTEARPALDVRLLGSLPPARVHALLGIVDCVVLPSAEEVWGLVVNEGLAAGAFCVVSRTAGAAELIRPDSNGLLVEPSRAGIAEGLKAAAARLPLDAGERSRIAAEARASGIEVVAERMGDALARLRALRSSSQAPLGSR